MLERTDRLALAVPRADPAIESFRQIFDCSVVGDEADPLAAARRVTLQWGRDQLELFEPRGAGPVASFLDAGRRGLFAGGFAVADPAAAAARFEAEGVAVREQGGERFVVFPEDLDGVGVILSRRSERSRVGLSDKIWQITYAVPELRPAVERFSRLLGLESAFTNFYTSEEFGYDGAITWFDPHDGGLLDSLEYLEPTDAQEAVARFVRRNGGTGIYMAAIESDDIPEIRRRVISTGGGWDDREPGGFIHPKRLHGLLLGLVTYEDWNAHRPLPVSE